MQAYVDAQKFRISAFGVKSGIITLMFSFFFFCFLSGLSFSVPLVPLPFSFFSLSQILLSQTLNFLGILIGTIPFMVSRVNIISDLRVRAIKLET